MKTIDDYIALITDEHRDKPLFVAMVTMVVQPLIDIANQMRQLVFDFDLDDAVGVQLDVVGEWVGLSRVLSVPLTGIYFSWDSTALLGWDSGSWKGDFDPTTGLTSLPDDEYRRLLKAKIAANQWDGTMEGAQSIWNQVFAGQQAILLQDNQDMSMTLGFVGAPLSAIQQALLTGGYFPLKPGGVRIKYYAIPPNTGPLFAWDASSPQLAGWETGSWAKEISTT